VSTWESVNVGLSCRAWCVARGGLLHQLGDDAVEAFLRVHEVAHLAPTWYQAHSLEQTEERGWHLAVGLRSGLVGIGAFVRVTRHVGCTQCCHETSHDAEVLLANVVHNVLTADLL
jgi:hypothetical protein